MSEWVRALDQRLQETPDTVVVRLGQVASYCET
jgi:hypothetical protein